jgi:DNA-binding HxlR family transcriptional regulator
MERKTYGQFCALARSLDRVGDRWTLLIVRELLLGPATFQSLQSALAGISPNLLVDRLRALVADGLATRSTAPARSKRVVYRLTAHGTHLEPVIVELIRWGARYMASGVGDDRVDPRWATLALRALLDGPAPRPSPGTIHLDVDGQPITIASDGHTRHVISGHHGTADTTLAATMPDLLAVASNLRPTNELTVRTQRQRALVRSLLAPHPEARPPT